MGSLRHHCLHVWRCKKNAKDCVGLQQLITVQNPLFMCTTLYMVDNEFLSWLVEGMNIYKSISLHMHDFISAHKHKEHMEHMEHMVSQVLNTCSLAPCPVHQRPSYSLPPRVWKTAPKYKKSIAGSSSDTKQLHPCEEILAVA